MWGTTEIIVQLVLIAIYIGIAYMGRRWWKNLPEFNSEEEKDEYFKNKESLND